MLSAIRDLGALFTKVLDNGQLVEGKVLSIVIDDEACFTSIDIENFFQEKKNLYLFKEYVIRRNIPAPFASITTPKNFS
ncbi:MAG: hypothetical protein ACMUJM_21390 [bacterium]